MSKVLKIHGQHDEATIQQLQTCVASEEGAFGVLCADGHLGYSMPIGGVVAYKNFVSPSGVGYDIACGNLAAHMEIRAADVSQTDMERLADEIASRISFGVGRKNNEPVDHPVLDEIAKSPIVEQRGLASLAAAQLGTVGSGNHYVDILEDEQGWLWVAVHFGSRGFGHKTASMFMNIAQGLSATAKNHDGEMMSPPLLLHIDNPVGQDYIAAMELAGRYAYAGREVVVKKVIEIFGGVNAVSVHNHHNFAWRETHFGEQYWVHRKGATPAFPNQYGFVGGSMGDRSVILQGYESEDAATALYSTVHGAGRVMSRNAAIKGKHQWQCPFCFDTWTPPVQPPKNLKCDRPMCSSRDVPLRKIVLTPAVDFKAVCGSLQDRGIILRGGGADEAPQVYRPLARVLHEHVGSVKVVRSFTPRIVVMAPKDTKDPYKD